MATSALDVPASLLPRIHATAARLGRTADELVHDALLRYLDEHSEADDSAPEAGFDRVVFGGDDEDELAFEVGEFRGLPLRRQVHLLLSRTPRFFRAGQEIPRAQAMSLGKTSA